VAGDLLVKNGDIIYTLACPTKDKLTQAPPQHGGGVLEENINNTRYE